MAQANRSQHTIEEYLWEEQRADGKHDYLDGQVYGMAGGSPEHSRIAVNLITALDPALADRDCQVFNSDLKVGLKINSPGQTGRNPAAGDFVTYPDASIVCGPLEFYKNDRFTLGNPTVLFEVLSPSTHNYDRSIKLEHYRTIASLLAYIMIDSERVWIEQYYRTGPQTWQVEAPLRNLADHLVIENLGFTIPLTRLYHRLDLNGEH